MDLALIDVPYMAGDPEHPAAEGARRMIEASGSAPFARIGPGLDGALDVNRALAAAVGRAIAAGRLPVAIAGSCVAAHGVLGGFDHAGTGVVWIDAHADFNTPDTTASGFFPGMTAAVLVGDCHREYWSQIGQSTPIREDAFVMFGVRDLSPAAERERLERSAITVAPSDDLGALDRLAVDDVYLHIDFDGFDPSVAPGIVDEPVPGGLTVDEAEAIVLAAAERFRIRAATLATYTPTNDVDDKTLAVAVRLLNRLATV